MIDTIYHIVGAIVTWITVMGVVTVVTGRMLRAMGREDK